MKRRRSEKEQKKLADDARLLRWWATWHHEQRDEARAKYPVLEELFRMFRNLDCVAPVQLIGLAQSINWAEVDYATKLTVLHEINNSITALRVKRDLQPLDNPFPREPLHPCRQIKDMMYTTNEAPTGTQPGLNKQHRSS